MISMSDFKKADGVDGRCSDDGWVEHDDIIRCPHCGNQENIHDKMHWSGDFSAYEEGHHY